MESCFLGFHSTSLHQFLCLCHTDIAIALTGVRARSNGTDKQTAPTLLRTADQAFSRSNSADALNHHGNDITNVHALCISHFQQIHDGRRRGEQRL